MTLSVILLSYNTRDITIRCLSNLESAIENLKKDTGWSAEVIVVDNGSKDGSVDEIKRRFSWANLIIPGENLGFAKGNNLGMNQAKGELFLLLNSDVYLEEESLSKVVNYFMKNTSLDVVGCQLMNPDGTIQPSYGYFPTLPRVAAFMFFVDNLPVIRSDIKSIHVRDRNRYEYDVSPDWITGAFVLIKKEVWEKVGGIDEKYFMYGEEMEWMYRIRKAGYKIGYTPTARAVHLGGASTKDLGKMISGEMQGYVYWFEKHNTQRELKYLRWILICGCAFKFLVWKIFRNNEYSQAHLRAFDLLTKTTKGVDAQSQKQAS